MAEVQKKIEQEAKLPSGYYVLWGGAFQNQQRAMKRLLPIVPRTILLTSFLLYGSLNSLRSAALIILALPFA